MVTNTLIVIAALTGGLAVYWLLAGPKRRALFTTNMGAAFPGHTGPVARMLHNLSGWRFVQRSTAKDVPLRGLLDLADSAYTPLQLRTLQLFYALFAGGAGVLLGAAVGLLLGLNLTGSTMLDAAAAAAILGGFGALIGWLIPKQRLKTVISKRTKAVNHELMSLVQLLRMAQEAGNTVPSALGQVTAFMQAGPARDEIARLNRALNTGTPFADAMDEFARRNDTKDARDVARLLTSIVADGKPRQDILAAKTVDMREGRMLEAKEQGQKNQAKVLIVITLTSMVSLTLPMLVIMAPDLMRSGGMGLGGL